MKKLKINKFTDIIKTPKKSVIPRSEKQKEYVRALRQSDIVISQVQQEQEKLFSCSSRLTMLLKKKLKE